VFNLNTNTLRGKSSPPLSELGSGAVDQLHLGQCPDVARSTQYLPTETPLEFHRAETFAADRRATATVLEEAEERAMAPSMRSITAQTLLLSLSIVNSAQAADARAHVGDVDRVQNQAQALFLQESRILASEAPVLFEDLLRTGGDARLKATLVDGTELTLGEKAELVVDEFVYEPGGTEGVLSIKVFKGAFLFVGGKVEEKVTSRVRIETSHGVLGVRGTTVWGGPIDGGWGMLVLDGEVTLTTPGGAVAVEAGTGTMLYQDGSAPFSPFPWSREKIDRAVATISFKE